MARSNAIVKLVFAAVVLWQVPQYLITTRFKEPYPALAMPSFSGTLADRAGNISFANVTCQVLFDGGRTASLSAYDLLSQAPSSHHGAIMYHMFGAEPVNPTPVSLQTLKARLFPGRALSLMREQQKGLDPQTKAWLKRRLEVIYPSQPVKAVTFVWFVQTFNINNISAVTTEKPFGTRQVRFE